ncbi:methylated-DNA--[protein]-cysteine S-methyltransferase [soil metagenome]
MGLFTAQTSLHTILGWLNITEDDGAITEVLFSEEPKNNGVVNDVLINALSQLEEYFSGKRKDFNLPLRPAGTPFQLRVWDELTKIPHGKTISYLELAKRLGDEKAIRAAASSNGKNPIAVVIPCHRVIGSDGSLTGYAAGLERKSWLLGHEQGVYTPSLFDERQAEK